jgi:hypothetical protein
MVKAILRTDGGLDVTITGAESCMLNTISYDQQIEISELLTRLICNAAINGVGRLGQPTLVRENHGENNKNTET